MSTVILDVTVFRAMYPEFSSLSDLEIENLFMLAQVLLENNDCSVVVNEEKRKVLLYLLTAHLAFLGVGISPTSPGAGSSPGAKSSIVGRISSATEGSVTIGLDLASNIPFRAAYFAQSKYGLLFWQMMAPYRTGLYYAKKDHYC